MTDYPPAGLSRRLAAAFYDCLPVAGLLMTVTLITVIARGGDSVPTGNLFYQLLLITVTAGFFVGSWCRGGQTIGMRAWRLRLECQSGERLNWKIGLLRFLAVFVSLAPLGLGFFWALIDPNKLTWHDRLTGTRMVLVPGKAV